MPDTHDETLPQSTYDPPVSALLTYGVAEAGPPEKWPDFRALGIGPEHIHDLIRMASDPALHQSGSDTVTVWSPIHALRALGELRAESAVELLLPLFHYDLDDDWLNEELPQVYGMLGPQAIAPLAAYLADATHPEHSRNVVSEALQEIGSRHPEARVEVVSALTAQLGRYAETDPVVNAFVIVALLDLKGIEALPVMERAFAARRVDESIVGDWDDVQVDLGLKEPDPNKKRSFYPFLPPTQAEVRGGAARGLTPAATSASRKTKEKAKRKMAKASRRKNRK